MGNVRYFFKGIEVDERTQEYINKRLKTLDRLLKNIPEDQIKAEVEIEMDKKGKFRVEIIIDTPVKLFRSEQVSESIEGSADIAQSEVKRQINEAIDKKETLQIRGGRSIKKKAVLDGNARF